ncbi:hypothetical protein MKY30_04940 [Oceanobacillus sp. FSL W8-0428]|uniref:Uncharacterized protein n=1 Tax=Oceanobacillus sojae TaxID=582851 RepID=A0A511ZLP9_9BACI|nr:hypothetical protein [Oceanobacillus sojae]GEN88382.1 hypothetical protein OSO01_31210 [Oceanobacillus sojae]
MNFILKSKLFWSFMVVLAFLLMVIGFFTKDLSMWVTAFIISILVKLYAEDILFSAYKNRLGKMREKLARKEG